MEPSRKLSESESCTSLLSGSTSAETSATSRLQTSGVTEKILVHGWPTQAKKLKELPPARLWRTTSQIAIALVPAFFIILGISICPLHDTRKSSPGQIILQAPHVASTLWPIAFAAVVGTMSKAIALHHAERGVKLGILETIMRSQTLFTTLKTSFGLQLFNVWTAVLFSIWTFSPVGGQAILRVLELKDKIGKAPVPLVYYPNTNVAALATSSFALWNTFVEPSRTERTMVYSAALQDPKSAALLSNDSSEAYRDFLKRINTLEAINGTRQDLWGNVRIPFLHLLPSFDESNRNSWVNISMDQVTPFASLMGVPIRASGDADVGTAELQLSSSYHVLHCAPWGNFSSWSATHPRINKRINTTDAWNYTNELFRARETQPDSGGTFFAVADKEAYGNFSTDARTIIMFGSADEYGWHSGYTFCGVKTEYIDVDVECARSTAAGKMTCVAKRARATKTSPEASNITALGDDWWAFHGPPEMTRLLPGTFGQYLKDPKQVYNRSYYAHGQQTFRNMPMSIFEARLALLLNTYWHISLDTTNFVGTDGLSPASPLDIAMSPGSDEHPLADWGSTIAYRAFPAGQIYLISPLWMTLYAVATAVLTLCAIATIMLQSRIRAPDMLGSVSTLTRDSPYVAAPPGGSGLESAERARLLKDMWVRIQDVRPNEKVGKIAFSDDRDLGARLEWDRLYE